MSKIFDVPAGMSRTQVARRFNDLLSEVRGIKIDNDDGCYGPWMSKLGDDSRWQLDSSNDYFLYFDDKETATFRYRYVAEDDETFQKVCRHLEKHPLLV